jgi:hypothetical protein
MSIPGKTQKRIASRPAGIGVGVAILAGLLLSSCAAGLGGLAVRGAAGAVARGTLIRSGASRVLVADPLVGMAAQRGVLREALHRVTAGGTRIAQLSIGRNGVISADGQTIAVLEASGGRIVVSGGRGAGVLDNGMIYEVGSGGQRVAVAALRGFVPSRGVRVGSTNGGAELRILHRNVVVDVLQVNNGFYLIRLPGGATEWAAAELVALALVAADSDNRSCPASPGLLVRTSGQAIAFDSCTAGDGAMRLETASGAVVVDSLDIASIIPGAFAEAITDSALRFTGGHSLFGNVERVGEAIRVLDERGGITVADVQRLHAGG